jgi:Ran GTPase-activating protein (RanGAP) involved in mRNA processing and transport
LQSLVLDNNELEDEGTAQIVQCLSRLALPDLTELSLEANMIIEDGMQALLDHHIPTLTRLNLYDNEDIPVEMAQDLVALYGPDVAIRFDDEIGSAIVATENEANNDDDEGLDEIITGMGDL